MKIIRKEKEIKELTEKLIRFIRSPAREDYEPEIISILRENDAPKDRVLALSNYIQKLAEDGNTTVLCFLTDVAQYAYQNKIKIFGKDINNLGRQILSKRGYTEKEIDDRKNPFSWGYPIILEEVAETVYKCLWEKELEKFGRKITKNNYKAINQIVQKIYDNMRFYGVHAQKIRGELKNVTDETFRIAKQEWIKKSQKDDKILEGLVEYYIKQISQPKEIH